MSWLALVPSLLISLGLLIVPGGVILWPWRYGALPTLALAGLLSVSLVGVTGVLAGAAGLPWQPWQLLVTAAFAAGCSWALSRRRRQLPGARLPIGWWRWGLAVAAAGMVIALVAFWGVPAPDRVSQTYDNVFHMAAIAAILDGRDPSSLALRTLIETGRATGYYPAAWHTLAATVVQMTGVDAATAVNALWIAVATAIWVPGVAWLSRVLLPDLPPRLVVFVSVPIAAGFSAMPYALLSWGTVYPTYLATSLLPAAVAFIIVTARRVSVTESAGRRSAIGMNVLAVLAASSAIGFAQPRVLASLAALLLPAVVASSWRTGRSAWTRGGRSRRRLIWWGAAAAVVLLLLATIVFAYLVRVLGLFDRPLEDRLGGPQAAATQSVWTGVWQVISQSWPTGVGATVTLAAVPLALAVLMGIVWTFRAAGPRWILVSYVMFALLYVLAAGSDSVFSKLATAIWYKDRYRLASIVAVLGVVFATRGVVSVVRWLSRRSAERTRRTLAVGSAWAVGLSSAFIVGATGVSGSVATAFRLPESNAGTAVVSAEQIAFFRGLSSYVPEGQPILGDPWDGSAWTQVYGDREPIFPHVNGQWDPERLLLAQRLQDIETDPAVCEAVRRLNVQYVVYSRHELGGGDPAGNLFPGPHRAVEAGLLTEVASAGETSLYRIDQCGRT